jgi:Na+/melibiose symporter-like transporter
MPRPPEQPPGHTSGLLHTVAVGGRRPSLGTQQAGPQQEPVSPHSMMAQPLLSGAVSGASAAAPSQQIPLCRKVAFAAGGIPNPITSIVMTFYLSPFLLEVARIRPASVGIIVLTGRFLDAFTDPLVGALSDHTRTRWGRRRPWIFGSIIPFTVSYAACFMTWELFGIEVSETLNFWYYLLVYCGMQAITTCYSVPYSALTMELSQDNAERDSATAWRMTTELSAVSGGTILYGLILAQLAPEGASSDQERRVAYPLR